jgi:hypothetical protein
MDSLSLISIVLTAIGILLTTLSNYLTVQALKQRPQHVTYIIKPGTTRVSRKSSGKKGAKRKPIKTNNNLLRTLNMIGLGACTLGTTLLLTNVIYPTLKTLFNISIQNDGTTFVWTLIIVFAALLSVAFYINSQYKKKLREIRRRNAEIRRKLVQMNKK